MNSYIYPIRENARGTNAELYSAWNMVEKYVFDKRVIPLIEGTNNVILDVGAGEGKYSMLVAPHAKELIVVEPDTYRLDKAKKTLKSIQLKKTFLAEMGEQIEIQEASVDVAMCIHLFQHITQSNADKVLTNLAKSLRPGGLLILFFSDNTEYPTEFHLSWMNKGKPIVAHIPESVFEVLTRTEHEGALQFRSIKKESIIRQLKKMGFNLEVSEGYMPVYPGIAKKLVKVAASVVLNPVWRHKLLHYFGYDNYIDRCVVMSKVAT